MLHSLKRSDSKRLAALHAACFPVGHRWYEIDFANQLELEHVFGFRNEAGFILCGLVAGEGEILTFAIDPDSRRMGYGRDLLSHAIEHWRTQNAESIFLEVATNNSAAIALYTAFGFKTVGQRPQYYGDGQDAWVMRLTLL